MKKKLLTLSTMLLILVTVIFTIPFAAAETTGVCGDGLTWSLTDDGTLIIEGSGEMNYGIEENPPWSSVRDEIREVILPQGLFNIADYAFSDCTNLEEVIIPAEANIYYIGDYAFSNCNQLESIEIFSNVEFLGTNVFEGCNNLTIYCMAGSRIELYANEYRIDCIPTSYIHGTISVPYDLVIPEDGLQIKVYMGANSGNSSGGGGWLGYPGYEYIIPAKTTWRSVNNCYSTLSSQTITILPGEKSASYYLEYTPSRVNSYRRSFWVSCEITDDIYMGSTGLRFDSDESISAHADLAPHIEKNHSLPE